MLVHYNRASVLNKLLKKIGCTSRIGNFFKVLE